MNRARAVAMAKIEALEEFSDYCANEYERMTEKYGAYGAKKTRAALLMASGLAAEQASILRAALNDGSTV